MPIHNLKAGVESLKTALYKTESKRNQWNKITMPLIKTVFQKVIAEFDINWNYESLTERKNAEVVNLSFGKIFSDISELQQTGLRNFEKFGGALSFALLYNGDVDVRIVNPYIEETVEPASIYKSIRQVAPGDIDEEFVYVQIGKFLNEIIAWESATNSDKLGQ